MAELADKGSLHIPGSSPRSRNTRIPTVVRMPRSTSPRTSLSTSVSSVEAPMLPWSSPREPTLINSSRQTRESMILSASNSKEPRLPRSSSPGMSRRQRLPQVSRTSTSRPTSSLLSSLTKLQSMRSVARLSSRWIALQPLTKCLVSQAFQKRL